MYIMNPHVIIYKTGFILRWFGYNWSCYLQFAVEVESYSTRSSMDCRRGHKNFKDLKSALIYAETLKDQIDGEVRECYYLS